MLALSGTVNDYYLYKEKGWFFKMNLNNMPKTKIGIVAVSRDCFPESLSVNRRKALVEAYTKNMEQMTFMNVLYVS